MGAMPSTLGEPRCLIIADADWQALHVNGEDPRQHLITTININGTMMYLEAHAVDAEIDGVQTLVNDTVADALTALSGDDPVETTTIAGRSYVLIATPIGSGG
jgi:hypothetical protein